MNYHDDDPSNPNLNLSQSELESLHDFLARGIVKVGSVQAHEGHFSVHMDAPQPIEFESTLDSDVAKDIFHPDDADLLPNGREENLIIYTQPHRINPLDEQPDDPVHEDVAIVLHWILAGTDVEQREFYWIHKQQGMLEGTVTTDYSRGGERISPKNLTRDKHTTPEEVAEFIDDLFALERPLALDDAEKLRKLGELLNA